MVTGLKKNGLMSESETGVLRMASKSESFRGGWRFVTGGKMGIKGGHAKVREDRR